MADISLIYDRSESDELGIRATAKEMGVELGFIPFHKVAFSFDVNSFKLRTTGRNHTGELAATRVLINRGQSKGRRVFAASVAEGLGKGLINPLSVELTCQSKVRSLLAMRAAGVRVPRTVYIPANPSEETGSGGRVDNAPTIAGLILDELGEEAVIKPDAGTHGRGVSLAMGRGQLTEAVRGMDQGITNPAGVIAQELVDKWFYDLRIIVSKEMGKPPHCEPKALARGGFKELRTNTFLGNMVTRAVLPSKVVADAEKAAASLARNSNAWVIALDAMPDTAGERVADEDELRGKFDVLEEPFRKVTKAKANPKIKTDFAAYTEAVETAYHDYMATEAYSYIEGVVAESLSKAQERVLFHEGNSCPEFWEQTRIVGGVNVAENLLRAAGSLLDR